MSKPLEPRTYKFKKAKTRFYCPLCRTERAFTLSPRLIGIHWIQIAVTSLVITIFTFPYLQFVAFASFFLVWGIFELVLRTLFRKQIPCPHCGFDASWYQRDVKVARKKVSEFWGQQASQAPSDVPEESPAAP